MAHGSPLKVLHIITGLRTGGAETMLLKLLQAELGGPVDHRVLSLEGMGTLGAHLESLGIPVATLDLGGRLAPFRTLAGLGRPFQGGWVPRVIQGWMYHGNLAAWFLSRLIPGTALAWNIRQTLYDPAQEKPLTWQVIQANARLSGGVDAILSNSRLSVAQHQAHGFSRKGWRVIPNGFDLLRWQPAGARREEVRQRLGIGPENFLVGQVARLHPMKDHGGVIRATALASSQVPRLRLLLAGSDCVPGQPALQGVLQETGMGSRTLLLGERADLPDLVPALDVLVSGSSHGEGFPNVIGEALACGVPVVATDVGDSSWVLGPAGRLVPPRDPAALATGLVDLAGLGPEGRQALGTVGRQHVVDHFSIGAVAAGYRALYTELAAR